ncbi:uncharacterized protein IWZ02DRAFT_158417 [Phyllosticta citriasiana]|uniref:uncharacterized protein n=1 Tax=Phyllosticta citriasiana TaxID=595635 RepID=UPI0030FD4742
MKPPKPMASINHVDRGVQGVRRIKWASQKTQTLRLSSILRCLISTHDQSQTLRGGRTPRKGRGSIRPWQRGWPLRCRSVSASASVSESPPATIFIHQTYIELNEKLPPPPPPQQQQQKQHSASNTSFARPSISNADQHGPRSTRHLRDALCNNTHLSNSSSSSSITASTSGRRLNSIIKSTNHHAPSLTRSANYPHGNPQLEPLHQGPGSVVVPMASSSMQCVRPLRCHFSHH